MAALGAALLPLASLVVGCPTAQPPAAIDGLRPWEAPARVTVPGGVVNAAGGTLSLARRLLVIDTRLGPLPIAGVYHSTSGQWRWSFEPTRLDGVLHDATGASYELAGLADGAVVPGTEWVRVDAARMKTRGGLVHEFDGAGRLAAVHWSSDPYPRLRYETGLVGAEVRVVAIDQCTAPAVCEPVYTLGWDAEARLDYVEDRAGRRAELDWDAAGRLVAARDAGDVAAQLPGDRYAYAAQQLTALTTSDGEAVGFEYAGGRVVRAGAAGAPSHSFIYQRLAAGLNQTLHDDPTGARTAYQWDDQRRVRSRTQLDLGEAELFFWDGLRITRHEQPGGVTRERTFVDETLVSERLADGNLREYQWNPEGVNRIAPLEGAVSEVRDDLGVQLSVVYDPGGRPLELTDGAGDVTRLGWNGVELASLERPSGSLWSYEAYGEHGWPTLIRNGGEIVDEPVHDAVGDRLQGQDLSDPTASSTPGVFERSFDADRRLETLVLADQDPATGQITERTLRVLRRADGRPLRVERPHGGDTEYLYDARGLLVECRERVDGLWQATTYQYDAAGRRTAEQKPNGMQREWSYDAAGRPRVVTSLRSGLVEAVLTQTWSAGRLSARHDSVRDTTELYLRDGAGRVERVVHGDGEVTELGYDARSRLAQVTFLLPGGVPLGSLAVEYDGADRETRILESGTPVLERLYAAGRLAETRYGNGLSRVYGYPESSDRWSGSETRAADGSFVAETVLDWGGIPSAAVASAVTRTADPLGLVPDPPPGSAPGEVRTTESYLLRGGPDPQRPHGLRLGVADQNEPFQNGISYYDALGNRLRSNHTPFGETTARDRRQLYNAEHNRLLAVEEDRFDGSAWVTETVRTYAYDEAGYAVEVDGVPITWTAQGRIESVGGMASFQWDAAGRPLSRTVAGEETVYWFGGRMEAPAGATPAHLDLHEVRLDLAGGDHRYRHLGPRGNVKFVSDSAGTVVAHDLWGAYGRVARYGPSDDARGFAGGSHAAGFVVLGARVLDPEAGRFLSPDPVDPLLDAYAYAWGNPVHLWDPSGLEPSPTPQGPPTAATVLDVAANGFFGVAGLLIAFGPGLVSKVLGGVSFLLGYAAQSMATAMRDEAARRDARSSGASLQPGVLPAIPPVPAAGIELESYCIDGFCFARPRETGRSPGGPTGGGRSGAGALDFGFADLSAGCGGSAPCGLGPELALLLPWILRVRRRRLKIR